MTKLFVTIWCVTYIIALTSRNTFVSSHSVLRNTNLLSSLNNLEVADNSRWKKFRGGSTAPMTPPLALTSSHWLSVRDCLESLQVSESFGLSNEEAAKRLEYYGANVLAEPPKKSLLALVLEQFEDKLVQILLSVAVLSGFLAFLEKDAHAFTEPLVIVAILVLNAVVGILQSRSAESSLDALKKLQPDNACVLRNGVWDNNFPTSQLVPGDIIYLRVGDKVPADARIIALKTNSFSTDEGSLTGESVSVSKSTESVDVHSLLALKTNMVFSGTLVASGGCYAVVVGTGAATEIGMINAGVQAAKEEHTKTPLAEKLDEFGDQLTKLIGVICLGVWLMSIPKFSNKIFSSWIKGAVYYAKIAVALGVAAIPEGLPAVITLCLSLGTRRMAKKNVIVRKLSSVETLGCTSVICTDKTGTLTTNQMTVKALVSFEKFNPSKSEIKSSKELEIIEEDDEKVLTETAVEIEKKNEAAVEKWNKFRGKYGNKAIELKERSVEGVSYIPVGSIEGLDESSMSSPSLQMIAIIASLCNEAKLEYREGQFDHIGEPTEAALKVLVEKLGIQGIPRSSTNEEMASQYNNLWASKFISLAVLEFTRDRKSMSVLVRPNQSGRADNMLLVKGAAEMVVSRCTKLMLDDGSVIPITKELRELINQQLFDIAKRPLRCLALAFKQGDSLGPLNKVKDPEQIGEMKGLRDPASYINLEQEMTLVGLCGIKDPARPEAAAAILQCRKAGIRVMMITGDSKETAVAIAKDVNILTEWDDVSKSAFTGKEFFSLPEEEQIKLLRSGNKVFCRTEPRDKQKLITMLEKLDEIPAMTGDGVNDAPALQQAAIGIAMGITGTEVAKGAADMILADDNFATIVKAVEEGRNIYANMQAFVCFLISCNIGEIASIFFATLLGFPEPLTPLHLLWVNLVTDGPPATALGFNPPDPKVMSKPPRARHESLLSGWLLTRYAITGLYVGFATIGAFVWWYLDKGVSISQLSKWGECLSWADFAHSAEAPHWPRRPCDIFSGKFLRSPQSMSLSVLVTIEMLKALSAVSLDTSLLRIQPWKNPWLISGVLVPFLLHCAVLYTPFLSNMFGLSPLSKAEWKVVLFFSLPILILEEILKLIGRYLTKKKLKQENAAAKFNQPGFLTPSKPTF